MLVFMLCIKKQKGFSSDQSRLEKGLVDCVIDVPSDF